jgi:hypothetical protein
MSWMNQVGNILKQYSSGGAAAGTQTAPDVNAHFDEVAKAVPSGTLADGIAAAMRSDKTPALGDMVSSMFGQSNGEQKAGLLNQLLGSLNPAALTQILSSAGLGGLSGMLTGNTQITPEQAQQVPPEVVQQMANHAEKNSPSIVDTLSNFYAQHPTLVKTLGGAALSIALAKVAQRAQG